MKARGRSEGHLNRRHFLGLGVAIMGETIIDGVTNIALSGDGRAVITHADPAPPHPRPQPGPRRVTTVADLRAVLADDVRAVTLVGTFPVTEPVTVARIPERNIRIESSGATIQGNGDDFRILSLAGGKGGILTIAGLTIDGGWRANPGECRDDSAANFFLPDLDYLAMAGCTTRYSRRTGILATNTGMLTLRNCVGYAMPRDFCWTNGSLDVLVDGCDVRHCGDDGIGCHVDPGTADGNRSVIIRNNRLYDTLGIKVLGGGKQILIENNIVTAPGFYGVRLGIDTSTGEGRGLQRNITVRGNTIENVRATSPCHPGQTQGVWLFMYAPDDSVQNVVIGANNLIRTQDSGLLLSSAYPWAGLGAYSKTAFLAQAVLDIGTEAQRYVCKNPGDIIGLNTTTGFPK